MAENSATNSAANPALEFWSQAKITTSHGIWLRRADRSRLNNAQSLQHDVNSIMLKQIPVSS
jgi:hypothetical protein